jgi:threonine/homoserine/homoserine lactone efflux protein
VSGVDTAVAFLAVAAVVIVTPGPDFALSLRNTLVGGRASGIATAWGVAVGQLIWALAASLGLAALVAASDLLFRAVQLVGAGYLCYLGAKSLWSAGRRTPIDEPPRTASAHTRRVGLRQGLVSNLGNPKMAAFFTGLLPQFAGSEGGIATFLAFGAVFSAMTLAWLVAVAATAGRLRVVLRRDRIRRAIEAITGTVLIALGVRVAVEGRV